jgi:hypothetical protein
MISKESHLHYDIEERISRNAGICRPAANMAINVVKKEIKEY